MEGKLFKSLLSFKVQVQLIPLRNYMKWFEEKLNSKYDFSLQGLKLRFLTFYNIIKGIIEYFVEINLLVSN